LPVWEKSQPRRANEPAGLFLGRNEITTTGGEDATAKRSQGLTENCPDPSLSKDPAR
jgi:hypothetical protein